MPWQQPGHTGDAGKMGRANGLPIPVSALSTANTCNNGTWMKKLVKWAGYALLGAAVLLAGGVGALYAATEVRLRRPEVQLQAVLPAGDALEGARLAQVLGCRGCHRDNLAGGESMHVPNVFRLVAPNLTEVRDRYDDIAWLRLMRAGTKADGTLAVGMPNAAHQRLTDREVADIVAYVRSVPRVVSPGLGRTRLYPLARMGMLSGKFNIESMAGDAPESAVVLSQRTTADRGEHLAQIACSGCHGKDLGGDTTHPHGAPSLLVAKAYDPERFARLLRTGETLAGTDSASGLMSEVSRNHFSHLTDAEIADLHTYLVRR